MDYRLAFLLVAFTLGLLCPPATEAQNKKNSSELVIAAAADLSSALREVAANYQKTTGTTLKLSFGSSGSLTQEIQNGAPFDIFFSADMGYPRQLISANEASPESLYQYAVGKLVIWVPANSHLDLARDGLRALLDRSVQKIAIANPQHAPYGQAAVAALKHAGLYHQIANKVVLGENVAQAAQFVESGNAQAGFVALAHAVAPGMEARGKYWEVPADDYPPLAQGVVILQRSAHKKEAAEFLDYIKSDSAVQILRKYGFTNPPAK